MTNTTNTDRSIVDRTIALLRGDHGDADNAAVAQALWLGLSLALVGGAQSIYNTATYTAPASGFQVLPHVVGWLVVLFIGWCGLGSLTGPALRIERWLDSRYPDYAVGEVEYSLMRDVYTSGVLVTYFSAYGIAIYLLSTMAAFSASVLDALDTGSFLFVEATVRELTVINSVGLILIASLCLVWGLTRGADILLGDDVNALSSAETGGFGVLAHLNGGDADGA